MIIKFAGQLGLLLRHFWQVAEHKLWVMLGIVRFALALLWRGLVHDLSKFSPTEARLFARYTPLLRATTYGSEEYQRLRDKLAPALEHHYAVNRHHPEHFQDGMRGMSLLDLVECFYDWKAAIHRHHDGDLLRSIAVNQERFGYSDFLRSILENSV